MKRFLALLAGVAFAAGCTVSPGTVDAGVVQGLAGPIMERHDFYIQIDLRLEQVEKETYLRSSQILRQILLEAQPVQ